MSFWRSKINHCRSRLNNWTPHRINLNLNTKLACLGSTYILESWVLRQSIKSALVMISCWKSKKKWIRFKRRIVSWPINSPQLWLKLKAPRKRTTYSCRGSATWKCWYRSNRLKMSKKRSKLQIWKTVWQGSEMKPRRRRISFISCKQSTKPISRSAVKKNTQHNSR